MDYEGGNVLINLICNECNKEFTLTSVKTKRFQKYIVGYFICPHCKHEYISYVTDKETKRIQLKIKSINKSIGTIANKKDWSSDKKLDKVTALQTQIERLNTVVSDRMDRLKQEYITMKG